MLTLKQIKAEFKKNNLKVNNFDERWELINDVDFKNDKKYIEFKERYLKNSRERFDVNLAVNLLRYGSLTKIPSWINKVYNAPDDESIKNEYQWNNDEVCSYISFVESNSTFSCAVTEFGQFSFSKQTNKYWHLFLSWYVRKSNTPYFKCAVPTTKDWKSLNDGLEKAGFELRAQCPSNHGKYKVNVWEYIKK